MAEKKRQRLSDDFLLDRILHTVVDEVKRYADFQRYHLSKYAEIGMSMSGEEDISKLLEMIVFEAREITHADAGTLYMVNDARTDLDFVILQNDSMNTRMGGTSGKEITLPPVPLYVGENENHANVSSHVALTGEIVNIPDVYESEEFDFTGPRKYDEATGYRSKSMLVIPLRNHENDIIGVLQLLNAQDPDTKAVIEFSDDSVNLVASLASQAAVAITKTRLIQDLQELLYAFIKSIAGAIDEKSPYTAGHISRVAKLTMMLAERVNEAQDGPFREVRFTPDEMEELRVAAWLHDVGKITTPEWVVDKQTKLQTIFDRQELVELRLDYIAGSLRAEAAEAKLALLQNGGAQKAARLAELDRELAERLNLLAEEKAFIAACNSPGEFMDDDKLARLREIARKTYARNGQDLPYLTEDEIGNLSIRKGSLTVDERKIIENHAKMTYKMLWELPFPKKMSRVPEYAGWHHEKLDGTGYPLGLKGRDIPLQARIVAVADVFEALTARDRPYKKAMPLSQAIKILGFMKKDNHIDADLHDLFVSCGVIDEYAAEELDPGQVDLDLKPAAASAPAPRTPAPAPAPEAKAPVQGDQTPAILLVEDSANTRMLVKFYLKQTPYRVDTAENGMLGLTKFMTENYDLVLMDLEMPIMDGYAASKAIRVWEQDNNLPPTPIIALTAHKYMGDEAAWEEAGITGFMTKPIKKQDFLVLIDEYTKSPRPTPQPSSKSARA